MGGAAYFVFNEAVKGGEHVIVPDLVGLPITQASFMLAENGLEMGKQKQVAHDYFPEYHVILQRPSANKVVRSGRKVNLTISQGRQLEVAPQLVGLKLDQALKALDGTRLVGGWISRMPSEEPRDTVLAQSPRSTGQLPTGSEIQLLVSDGPVSVVIYMPDLTGKPVEDALETLAVLGVDVTPYKVRRQGADYNVVLDQSPESGTRVLSDTAVSIDVRLLPLETLPNMRRKVVATYTVPRSAHNALVRADVVDQGGQRHTVFPEPKHYVAGEPPRFPGGTRIIVPVMFTEQATVEFFVDDVVDRAFFYEGDADPIVTDYSTENALEAFGPNPLTRPTEFERRFGRGRVR